MDLTSNAVDVLPAGRLTEQLAEGRPLRVKLGIDPTTSDIHLGHTVVLGKLREFQDAGHQVVLIVGDFTAQVGDPSGRSSQRPMPTAEEITANAETYQEQAFKVLDPDRTEVRFNSEWLRMDSQELLSLLAKTTVARLLERDDFQKRMAAGAPIAALELLYPLLQGYDSVAIDADIEVGGTDQKFNLLFGRDMQAAYGRPQQSIMTLPILVGIDGEQKMSKSLDNYVGVTDAPEEMFGRLMRVPDTAMAEYFRLLLNEEVPTGPPERGEARAGAAPGRPLPRRGRSGRGRGALQPPLRRPRAAGRSRGGEPRPVCGERRRPGPPAAADGRPVRDQLQRGEAPDRPGRRQARRRDAPRRPPRLRSGRPRRAGPAGREAPLQAPACAPPSQEAPSALYSSVPLGRAPGPTRA